MLGSRLCVIVVLMALAAESAAAHDFWVQPAQFRAPAEAATPFTLQVGHGPLRQRSPIPRGRITRFEAFGPGGGAPLDIRDGLSLGGDTADGRFQFREPGAYVLVLETDDRAQSHLPAIRFNDYLQVEGLTPALELRRRTHRMDVDGSESYSRIAKSIVRIGESGPAGDLQVTRELGLTLEIVLERNPYGQPRAAQLPARVVYEGRPLGGALIKLTDLEHDAMPYEMHVTDRDGRATFVMPEHGKWLLNVIWTKPLPSSRETDFETVFSSLSFGFP